MIAQLGDYVNLAMGVILAGRVKVGSGATIFSRLGGGPQPEHRRRHRGGGRVPGLV